MVWGGLSAPQPAAHSGGDALQQLTCGEGENRKAAAGGVGLQVGLSLQFNSSISLKYLKPLFFSSFVLADLKHELIFICFS